MRDPVLDELVRAATESTAPTRSQVRQRRALFVAVAAAVSGLIFLAMGGVRVGARPLGLIGSTFAAGVVAFGALLWSGVSRGGSMLGRPRKLIAATVAASALGLFAWKVGISGLFDRAEPIPGRPGLRCLGLGALIALAPFSAFVQARRIYDAADPRLAGAGVGAAAGAFAWAVLDLWCPSGDLAHVALGHLVPMLMWITIGALLGMSALRRRLS